MKAFQNQCRARCRLKLTCKCGAGEDSHHFNSIFHVVEWIPSHQLHFFIRRWCLYNSNEINEIINIQLRSICQFVTILMPTIVE